MEYRAMRIKGEASLELVISIFCALLLLVTTARVFVWLNERMVLRQVGRTNPEPQLIGYEQSRVEAGSVKFGDTICTECCADIIWGNGSFPTCCDATAGNWRYICIGYPDRCLRANSWTVVPDTDCWPSTTPPTPPDRRCAQRGPAPLEIQVNETDHPRLNIFENWPSSR